MSPAVVRIGGLLVFVVFMTKAAWTTASARHRRFAAIATALVTTLIASNAFYWVNRWEGPMGARLSFEIVTVIPVTTRERGIGAEVIEEANYGLTFVVRV